MSGEGQDEPAGGPAGDGPDGAPAAAGPASDAAAQGGAAVGAPDSTEESPPEELLRLAEGLIFASAEPVPARVLAGLLPDATDVDAVLAALRARYAGRGVELVEAAGGWQFRTAADLAPRLTRVVKQARRLPRAAMETIAIIAYHQPVTRTEIEEIRGASLSQATVDTLLEAGLVAPKGRKEVPGRPTLWGTTPAFLAQFGLRDLRDLPRREDLLVEPPPPGSPPSPEAADAAEAGQGTGPAAEEGAAPADADGDRPPAAGEAERGEADGLTS